MIRQRNIEPQSEVGVEAILFNPLINNAAVAARAYVGIPIINADKVQLIDLTVHVDVAVVGGGTLGFDIYKSPSNVIQSNAGTLVKACQTGVSALAITKTDLRNVAPIDPRGLLAGTPNDFLLQLSYVNTGTVTTVTLSAILRYRRFNVTKDS